MLDFVHSQLERQVAPSANYLGAVRDGGRPR